MVVENLKKALDKYVNLRNFIRLKNFGACFHIAKKN